MNEGQWGRPRFTPMDCRAEDDYIIRGTTALEETWVPLQSYLSRQSVFIGKQNVKNKEGWRTVIREIKVHLSEL